MYVTPEEFLEMSPMPEQNVHTLNNLAPKYLEHLLKETSSRIDARLRKRYAAPFQSPVPEIVKGWVIRIATPRAYIRLGIDPQDLQFETLRLDAEAAWGEVAEAANAHEGLYDLPLRANTTASGITTTATLAYSEASPYEAFDVQRRRVYGQR